jgi:hypothetical protein
MQLHSRAAQAMLTDEFPFVLAPEEADANPRHLHLRRITDPRLQPAASSISARPAAQRLLATSRRRRLRRGNVDEDHAIHRQLIDGRGVTVIAVMAIGSA